MYYAVWIYFSSTDETDDDKNRANRNCNNNNTITQVYAGGLAYLIQIILICINIHNIPHHNLQ